MLAQLQNLARRPYTLDEYFALEHLPEGKYEFWDGDVFCMRSERPLEKIVLSTTGSEEPTMLAHQFQSPARKHTLDEYAALEAEGDARYEYWDGTILCMSGGTPQHARISYNVTLLLGGQLKGSRCLGATADQAIKTPKWPPYRYPDMVVTCGQQQFEKVLGISALLNPTLVIEVLSPATEWLDHNTKKEAYQDLPSLQQYVLVSQHEVRMTIFTRIGNTWQRQDYTELLDRIRLVSINCELALQDIYENVEFD